jgi:hypothetical protein
MSPTLRQKLSHTDYEGAWDDVDARARHFAGVALDLTIAFEVAAAAAAFDSCVLPETKSSEELRNTQLWLVDDAKWKWRTGDRRGSAADKAKAKALTAEIDRAYRIEGTRKILATRAAYFDSGMVDGHILGAWALAVAAYGIGLEATVILPDARVGDPRATVHRYRARPTMHMRSESGWVRLRTKDHRSLIYVDGPGNTDGLDLDVVRDAVCWVRDLDANKYWVRATSDPGSLMLVSA